jgi:heat shock protein HslJ
MVSICDAQGPNLAETEPASAAAKGASIMTRFIGVIVILVLAGCGGGGSGADKAAGAGDPLADTAWELRTIAEAAVLDDVTVTAEFKEGRIGGKASCNQYFASYEVKGDSLRIGPAGATKMMCPEPVMAQEDVFLAFLQDAKTFRIVGGQLHIVRSDGGTLTFAPVPTGQPKD